MITGTKASFNHTVHNLYGHMLQKVDKKQLELLEVEGVANVIEEKVGCCLRWLTGIVRSKGCGKGNRGKKLVVLRRLKGIIRDRECS